MEKWKSSTGNKTIRVLAIEVFETVNDLNSKRHAFKVNESRSNALFVLSGSIKKLFSIDCVNTDLFFLNVSFNRFCPVEKVFLS